MLWVLECNRKQKSLPSQSCFFFSVGQESNALAGVEVLDPMKTGTRKTQGSRGEKAGGWGDSGDCK